jgi:RNA polymerase sigma-32 factor
MASQLPVLRSSFDIYLEEINRFPLLTREEEQRYARKFVDKGDLRAAQKLVTSNLRFVVKIAYEYRNYEVKLADLTQEGNIGLMKAVSKFNPDRGYRLISYAVWWIKAYMQNYIVKNWSVVKLRSGGRSRSLFFRGTGDEEPGGPDPNLPIADEDRLLPEVSEKTREERALNRETRLAMRDFSLDAMMDEEGKRSWLDMLPSEDEAVDDVLVRQQEQRIVSEALDEIERRLNPKERYILEHRVLADEPETLQQIGERFQISRERVRQIEAGLKNKIEKSLKQSEAFADEP